MTDRLSSVNAEFNVEAPMRDGVVLRANIFRPVADGPFPVLLLRTCYSKDSLGERAYDGFDPWLLAREGFIAVIQDVRGTYCSDGDWIPGRREREDGYDTVEWAARLPGANGRVGMFGGSYVGGTQWEAALSRPPSLRAIAPLFNQGQKRYGTRTRGGALHFGGAGGLERGFDFYRRTSTSSDELEEKFAKLADEIDHLPDRGYWGLPARDLATMLGLKLCFREIDDERPKFGEGDPATAPRAYERVPEEVAIHITSGWYDQNTQGTLDQFAAMARLGRDVRMIVGPWTHRAMNDPVGDQNYGIRSARESSAVDESDTWGGRHLAWFTRHLMPDESVKLPDKRVRIFVMGRNEWRDEDTWPLERAADQRWYLRADGSLTPDGPEQQGSSSHFTYDPNDPVPMAGGNTTTVRAYRDGPIEQGSVESRDDVLVFTSAPLQEDLEVTGRVKAVLEVQSSAPSTDWIARLCDVDATGRSINICDGILRVPDGADMPGTVEIDVWSTSNVFLAGHRLRVQVTSSCFPRWDRNLNTGTQNETRMQVAHQHVYHGGDGSYIVLPIVKNE